MGKLSVGVKSFTTMAWFRR